MKGNDEVISEFNEHVNMTASELESWLKSDDSRSAGWPKDDAAQEGDDGGETVGHDSGRKIVEILKANPDKKPDEYTEDQIEHMRKVVAYCKRHIAQEKGSNSEKSNEEVKETKSYASLKNWGHDFLRAQGREDGVEGQGGENGKGGEGKEEEEEEEEEEELEEIIEIEDSDDEEEAKKKEDDKKAGDKRKMDEAEGGAEGQNGANKKRETRQGEGAAAGKNGEKESAGKDEDEEEQEQEQEQEEERGDENAEPKKGPQKGDTVSWNWGGGQPEGKVLDVKGETTSIETKRGNEVTRHGDPEDPAVVLDTGKSKAIKSNHELNETS